MSTSAVITELPASGDRPSITFRQAGDRYVLIEYGDAILDLRLNFYVIAVLARLTEGPPPGFVEAAPGLRSILIGYDPRKTHQRDLVDWLADLHERESSTSTLVIPSRRITLPIAFDDSTCGEAVARYTTTIRPEAPNTVGGTNIDYVVRYNGLPDREALYDTVLGTEWWNAFTGFFPGLPFMFPLDGRHEITVPKYNPTRTWTAEGAVGLGGPCVAIYPVESPGGYQLFGRTVPVYDILGRNRVYADDPILIRPGDRVRWARVSEDELNDTRARIFEDRYDYEIEESPFEVADYLKTTEANAVEAEEFRVLRAKAAQDMEVP